ncbi:MAG: SDR family NAD(P)-dependent oxidoreductase [Candidatus Micrarchaeota archaeon]|nr:SDR family NAD(P)-dependent oxidoreductase [Candidatus Micrarchaeota archaeon]
MKTRGNVVLITGGSSGIGLSLAESFVKSGNEVIICGRSTERLEGARAKLPSIHTRKCDVSKEDECRALYDWASSNFKVNVLVNNAGIQRRIDLKKGLEDLENSEDEITINLKSQIYMSALFIPLLSKREESAIINISSGLGFVPLAIFPVYSATKAAIHSFSMSLRHQLRDTTIKVFEVIPPTTDTNLKGARKNDYPDKGIPPSEVAEAAMKGIESDQYEIAVGRAQGLSQGSREEKDQMFKNMNH